MYYIWIKNNHNDFSVSLQIYKSRLSFINPNNGFIFFYRLCSNRTILSLADRHRCHLTWLRQQLHKRLLQTSQWWKIEERQRVDRKASKARAAIGKIEITNEVPYWATYSEDAKNPLSRNATFRSFHETHLYLLSLRPFHTNYIAKRGAKSNLPRKLNDKVS